MILPQASCYLKMYRDYHVNKTPGYWVCGVEECKKLFFSKELREQAAKMIYIPISTSKKDNIAIEILNDLWSINIRKNNI